MDGKFSATCFMSAAILAAGANYIYLTFNRAVPTALTLPALAKHPQIQYLAIAPLTDESAGGAMQINLMDWEFFNSSVLISSISSSSPIAGDVIRL
jgi:hypothetical protein